MMIGDADIRKSLREVADFLRERSEDVGYGYFRPEDPHDFTPDGECCTPEEIEAHHASCEAWLRGEYVSAALNKSDVDAALARGEMPAGVPSMTLGPDGTPIHITHAPWGIGTYVVRDPEMLAMACKLDAIACDMPEIEDP